MLIAISRGLFFFSNETKIDGQKKKKKAQKMATTALMFLAFVQQIPRLLLIANQIKATWLSNFFPSLMDYSCIRTK